MNSLTTAKNDLEKFQHEDGEFSAKLVSTEADQNSQHQELESAIANRDAIEKLYIQDRASEAEVDTANQLCDTLKKKLAATNRRVELIKAARNELVPKIAAAAQNLKIARRDFCVQVSNEKIEKIKQNKQLRELLLEAMSAFAANGQYHFTFTARRFVEERLAQILPEITESEVRAAAEDFKVRNSLED